MISRLRKAHRRLQLDQDPDGGHAAVSWIMAHVVLVAEGDKYTLEFREAAS